MKYTVTIFKNLFDTSSAFNRDVSVAINRIRNGNSKELVEQIRQLPKEKADELKKALPGACYGGSFRNRSIRGLIKESGLMIIDLDGLENAEQERDNLRENPYIYSAWVSPSGKGVKALVKILPDAANYKAYFESFGEYLASPYWDGNTSDISRFSFESYDPDIWVNEDSELWTEKKEPELADIGTYTPSIKLTSENKIINRLQSWWNKKFGNNKGSRNNNIFIFSCALNEFGINKSVAIDHLMQFERKDFPRKEIETIVNSAYKKTENHGSKFFEDEEVKQEIEKQIRSGKQNKDIVRSLKELDKDEVEQYISNTRDNLSLDSFWFYDENNKLRLSIHKFKFWLEQNSFFKYFPSETSSTYSFIKKDQNLLEETNEKRIKDYTLNYILNKPNIGFGPYDFMAGNNSYFRPDFLNMIDTANVCLKEDDKETCYIYYRNCVLEITANEIKEIDYIDIDGFVWKRQIIDRDFKRADHHDAVFRKFIWLISGKDVKKYNSLKSVIGYLMHSFKTSANNKAIVFNDETISENPNGGSGKGLFWNALKHMKKVAVIDGKTFEFTKSFPYQTVSTDTQILVFDDVKKNFNFESLFSLITEGITLEYKGQDAIQVPVEKSPKLLITTNYTLGGVGGSHERRKFEIEVSSYFSYMHTPLDEFGHMLFTDWDEDEWSRFDNYMVNCEQYYLKNGLVKHDFNNLEIRKFITQTSHEFYEWSHDNNLPLGERIDKSKFFARFVEEYPDMKRWLTQRRFTKWLETFGKFKGLEVNEGRTNSERWIMFGNEHDSFPF